MVAVKNGSLVHHENRSSVAMCIHISEGEKTVAKSRLARSMETLVYLTLVLILFKNIMLLQY